jgi:hypothetical protein
MLYDIPSSVILLNGLVPEGIQPNVIIQNVVALFFSMSIFEQS